MINGNSEGINHEQIIKRLTRHLQQIRTLRQ